MSDVTKAEDVVPVTTPVFNLDGIFFKFWKPIPMGWPQDWRFREEPCSDQQCRLYVQPPGWNWVVVDIHLPVENNIIMNVDNPCVFSNWQYGGVLQSLITTYAHKFAMRM